LLGKLKNQIQGLPLKIKTNFKPQSQPDEEIPTPPQMEENVAEFNSQPEKLHSQHASSHLIAELHVQLTDPYLCLAAPGLPH
jgi:hypothetical protein